MTENDCWELKVSFAAIPPSMQTSRREDVAAFFLNQGLSLVEGLLSDQEWSEDPDHWRDAHVMVYLADETRCRELSLLLQNIDPALAVTYRLCPADSWQEVWDESVESFEAGPFLVTASARKQRPKGKILVQLHPSSAFGDGKHITTRVTLEFLGRLLRQQLPHSLLDVGCGNGVLGIAAALAGVSLVEGTDVVDEAVAATRANARLNQVRMPVRLDADPFDGRHWEWVVANIPAVGLASLMPRLHRCLLPNGSLITSGFFSGDQEMVVVAARQQGLVLQDRYAEKDWVVLRFQ